jgi:RNA polymerase sigma-70 factor, ECF subfamily
MRTLDKPSPGGLVWQHAPSRRPMNTDPAAEPADDPDDARAAECADLVAAQAGDRAAFSRIVALYWDRLHRWLFHMTRDRHQAEDLTQETFLKALAHISSFRAGSNFRAWLFRIGHNNFVNLKRAGKRPEFKAALLMHTQDGMSYREIAAIVKTTEETARWRVFKARQKLMKVLHPDLLPDAVTEER